MKAEIRSWALCAALIFLPAGNGVQPAGVSAKPAANVAARTLSYVMRGEVRFLLFWVGRDDVGGGTISLLREPESAGPFREETEVLFGSNPERVPGKVNLWGYGKEQAWWAPAPGEQLRLERSVFEGFMRPREELPSDVKGFMNAHKSEGSFLYKAIRSEVDAQAATTEIRFFVEKDEFNYRAPQRLIDKSPALNAMKPYVRRELPRQTAKYEDPAGFLTAMHSLIGAISDEAARNPRNWTALRPSIRYAYHAKPYRLSVTRLGAMEKFEAAAMEKPDAVFQNIAMAGFRIENLKDALQYEFSLWFALSGPMQGLPLRITHQPNWWLRIRLDLATVQVKGRG